MKSIDLICNLCRKCYQNVTKISQKCHQSVITFLAVLGYKATRSNITKRCSCSQHFVLIGREACTLSVKKAVEASPNISLRKARQERGWSQQELADLIGAPQSFMISRWENGTAYPGPRYQEKLSSVFGKCYEALGLLKFVSPSEHAEVQTPIIDPAIPMRQPGTQPLIGRSQILERIKQHLCSGEAAKFIALNGLPGVGKTALAMELSTLPDIQEHFQDGLLWATLGPRPDLCAQLRCWGRLLGIKESEAPALEDCDSWVQALRQAIGARKMLLILDDVWNIEEALAYMIGGPCCTYLLTTRIPEVATRFAGKQAIQISELTLGDSVQLLKQIVPVLVEKEADVIYKLVQASGGLPLILTLMGNYLLIQMRHRQQRRIQKALSLLLQPEERMNLTQPNAGIHRDQRLLPGVLQRVQAIIGMSEALLDEAARQALYALSAFPASPATFSEEAALFVAEMTPDTLDRLVDAGLVECNEEGRYQLHQSIVDYARTRGVNTQGEERLVAYVFNYVREHQEEEKLLEQENCIILTALKIAAQREHQAEIVECEDSFVSSACI